MFLCSMQKPWLRVLTQAVDFPGNLSWLRHLDAGQLHLDVGVILALIRAALLALTRTYLHSCRVNNLWLEI